MRCHTQAKDLFRDADAAQKFFTKFKRETEEIPVVSQASQAHSAARTFPKTAIVLRQCSGATLVALPTAWNAALCGLACHHNIVNYSSELSTEHLPDSISSSTSHLSISECLLMLYLLSLRFSEQLEVEHAADPSRKIFRTLSRICVKADPWVIPTFRVLQGTVSSSSIILAIFILMPRWNSNSNSSGTLH